MGAIKHEVKRAIYQIYKEKGRFPTLQEMCEALSFSADNTRKCMGSLAEDGHIEPIGDWYRYPDATRPITHDEVIKLITSEEREEIAKEITKELEEAPVIEVTEEPIIIEADEEKNTLSAKISTSIFKKFLKEKDPPIQLPKRKGRPPKSTKSQIEGFIKSREKGAITDNITLYGVPIYVIQIAMGVIGIGASIISIYYTAVWLIEFLPIPFALLLSSIMVGFSVSAFETVILFISGQVTRSKISKVIISGSFIVLWILVACFSIASTVAGQFNVYTANIRERAITGRDSGKATWSILQERKRDLQKRLDDQHGNADRLNKILSGFGDIKTRNENAQVWYESQFRLQKINEEIDKTSIELSKIRDEEERQIKESKKTGSVLLSGDKADVPDFYGWMAGIFNVKKDWIQFLMSLFPAIFVDIISPTGIALALFLRNKYKKV